MQFPLKTGNKKRTRPAKIEHANRHISKLPTVFKSFRLYYMRTI